MELFRLANGSARQNGNRRLSTASPAIARAVALPRRRCQVFPAILFAAAFALALCALPPRAGRAADPDAALAQTWWQVTIRYDAQGLTVLQADPIPPMTKAVVTPGLAGAPVRLAYDVAWLDAGGAELAATATEVPLGVRAALRAGANPGPTVVVHPAEGVRVLRLSGPQPGAAPARLRLSHAAARDRVPAQAGVLPAAFASAQFDLSLPPAGASAVPRQGPLGVTKVRDTGADGNRLVFVVVGDGYTTANLATGSFTTATQNLVGAFTGFSPWDVLFAGTNVYRIDVASNEQGTDRDPLQTSPLVDTYFNSTFWFDGVTQRLLAIDGTGYSRATACADSYVGVGMWDQIFVLVNSTTYGGSGGGVSVTSVHSSAPDILRHEDGHSFAGLADEYVATFSYPPGDSEPNVDFDYSGAGLKWLLWVEAGTPLPTPDTSAYNGVVGAFEGARYLATGIYRPCRYCLMRALGQPFCPVCKEAHIVRYFLRVAPADALSPAATAEVPVPAGGARFAVTPIPFSGFQYAWTLDGAPLSGAASTSVTLTQAQLTPGVAATLSVSMTFPTALVRTSPVQRTYSWAVRATEPPHVPPAPAILRLY